MAHYKAPKKGSHSRPLESFRACFSKQRCQFAKNKTCVWKVPFLWEWILTQYCLAWLLCRQQTCDSTLRSAGLTYNLFQRKCLHPFLETSISPASWRLRWCPFVKQSFWLTQQHKAIKTIIKNCVKLVLVLVTGYKDLLLMKQEEAQIWLPVFPQDVVCSFWTQHPFHHTTEQSWSLVIENAQPKQQFLICGWAMTMCQITALALENLCLTSLQSFMEELISSWLTLGKIGKAVCHAETFPLSACTLSLILFFWWAGYLSSICQHIHMLQEPLALQALFLQFIIYL